MVLRTTLLAIAMLVGCPDTSPTDNRNDDDDATDDDDVSVPSGSRVWVVNEAAGVLYHNFWIANYDDLCAEARREEAFALEVLEPYRAERQELLAAGGPNLETELCELDRTHTVAIHEEDFARLREDTVRSRINIVQLEDPSSSTVPDGEYLLSAFPGDPVFIGYHQPVSRYAMYAGAADVDCDVPDAWNTHIEGVGTDIAGWAFTAGTVTVTNLDAGAVHLTGQGLTTPSGPDGVPIPIEVDDEFPFCTTATPIPG